MPKTDWIVGAFDTKGEDHAFLREEILKLGHQVLTVNIGVLAGTTLFPVDIDASEVLRAAGLDLEKIRARKDKAEAMKAFDQAPPNPIRHLYDHGRFYGVIQIAAHGA